MNNRFRNIQLVLVLILKTCISHGQVQDNFSDGDFTNNPTWGGDVTKFSVSTGMLNLQAPAVEDKASLSTPSAAIHNASWEFYLKMGFATSGTSLTKVYLISDQADLKQSLNGYFVMIGNTSDEVSLYKQTGSTITEIIDGLDARINFSSVSIKVKVTRNASGIWNLYTDTSTNGPTGAYILEGVTTDLTHSASAYFGVHCTYIASRSTLFWFDDIAVTGTAVPDLVSPIVTSVDVIDHNNIAVNFSEVLEITSAQEILNYTIDKGIGNPASVALRADNKSVLLKLNASLTNGMLYTLQISRVKDTDGNAMSPASSEFQYFVPLPTKWKDIIVTELMADPSPVVALPESEFVELLNRSSNPIDLQEWKFSDGSSIARLPHYILMPGSRCLLTPTSTAGLFSGAVGVSNFPSLNNTGDNIIIRNSAGIMIDSIAYSQAWYHSDEKKDGGWSLEIIDPENLCEEDGNWTASEDLSGGTPGVQNSVMANNPDLTAPTVVAVISTSPTSFEIRFDEKMEGNSQPSVLFDPVIQISELHYSYTLREILCKTSEPAKPSTQYTITLSNIFDCSGNALVDNSISFVLPERAKPNDILINEVLFNPKPGGADFIEIYNKTSKHLSLKKWVIANYDENVITNSQKLEMINPILPPNSFFVFTPNKTTVKAHYPRAMESALISTPLPSMPDDEGSLALVDSLGEVIDHFHYKDDYHVIFLKETEGVSLERVALDIETNNPNNWRSASQTENFATPGYKNSASTNGLTTLLGEVSVDPEIFSPQVPPQDFAKINYHFERSGFVANAIIYDLQGRMIKVLANNEVLGVEGFFRWDGDRDDGGRARAGYYVANLEVYDSNGWVNTFRRRVVVAYH